MTGSAAKNIAGAGAVKSAGALGAILGPLAGVAGGALGTWCSWSAARYQSERNLIVRSSLLYVIGLAIFSSPFIAMQFGWQPWQVFGPTKWTMIYLTWMAMFMTLNGLWIFAVIKMHKSLVKREQDEQTPELPKTAPLKMIERYEGRRWTSQREFLGLPIVDVAFSSPASFHKSDPVPKARGWIAIGDHAVGRLLALGNIARAPVAIGTISIGVVSFGVISGGLVSLGVVSLAGLTGGIVAIGALSIGVISLGYLSAGIVAIAWMGAKGVVAIAVHYADGVQAFGKHAGDEVAQRWMEQSQFLQTGDTVLRQSNDWISFPLVLLIVGAILLFTRLAYRKIPLDEAAQAD